MFKKLIRKILNASGIYYDYLLFRERYFPSQLQKEEAENINRAKQFYGQFVSEGSLCFDIGANTGSRTAALLGLKAKVVAVEPQTDCCKYLKKKFKNRAEILNIGLDADEGEKNFFIANFHAASSLSKDWITQVLPQKSHKVEVVKSVIIKTSTLDKLIEKYGVPDFCKIDVEGYELQVLKGLNKPVKTISFEYTFPELKQNAIDCLLHLYKLGKIECNYSEHESMRLSNNTWVESEKFIEIIKNPDFNASGQGDIYIKFIK